MRVFFRRCLLQGGFCSLSSLSTKQHLLTANNCLTMQRTIAPSMLSADFGHLERDTRMIDRSAAEWVHIDVMDGVFVPTFRSDFPC